MISVVACHQSETQQALQERNVAKTIGIGHEFLPVGLSLARHGHASLYNKAAAAARGDIIAFVGHDCFFMNENWGARLAKKFAENDTLCIAGVAGTQYLAAGKCSWTAAGSPLVKGRIIYHLLNDDFFAVVFSTEKGDCDVVACDGIFMAVRASLFEKIRFDEKTFTGEHFHDLDFCLQARPFGRVIVTDAVTLKKRSQTAFDEHWKSAGEAFLRKNRELLPASCSDQAPGATPGRISQIVNLNGKVSKTTIC